MLLTVFMNKAYLVSLIRKCYIYNIIGKMKTIRKQTLLGLSQACANILTKKTYSHI